MELRDVIKARRSIRKYTDKAVEPEKIAELIEAARLCQSGHNKQPWRFLVLEGERRHEVTAIMREYLESLPEEQRAKMGSNVSTAKVMDEAPVLILVFRVKGDEDSFYSDVVSVGAAIEHICLTATDLGLGSLWIRQTRFTEDRIAEHFGYGDMQMISAISVGYPAEEPDMRPRLSTEDILLKA